MNKRNSKKDKIHKVIKKNSKKYKNVRSKLNKVYKLDKTRKVIKKRQNGGAFFRPKSKMKQQKHIPRTGTTTRRNTNKKNNTKRGELKSEMLRHITVPGTRILPPQLSKYKKGVEVLRFLPTTEKEKVEINNKLGLNLPTLSELRAKNENSFIQKVEEYGKLKKKQIIDLISLKEIQIKRAKSKKRTLSKRENLEEMRRKSLPLSEAKKYLENNKNKFFIHFKEMLDDPNQLTKGDYEKISQVYNHLIQIGVTIPGIGIREYKAINKRILKNNSDASAEKNGNIYSTSFKTEFEKFKKGLQRKESLTSSELEKYLNQRQENMSKLMKNHGGKVSAVAAAARAVRVATEA